MSNIKLKCFDTTLNTRSGISKTGKPFSFQTQNFLVEFGGEVRNVPIAISDGGLPFKPGNYTIDSIDLIQIGRYGFEFARFKPIVPVFHSPLAPATQVSKVA